MSDKILKLSQAQTLYQDLRERIDALPTDSDIPSVPVQDVQIDNTSILNNSVANIPIGSANNLGVVRSSSLYGANIVSNGNIYIAYASPEEIKMNYDIETGSTLTKLSYHPITPRYKHQAVFYGLAKAAGDDTQSASNNNVGTYTDSAKASIQNMLGVTSLFANEEHSTATAAHSVNSLFMMDGKLHQATSAIAIGDAVTVGTNCEVVKADEVFVKNTDIPVEYGTGIGSLQTKSFTYNGNVFSSTASGVGATAIGISTQASGASSHSEGESTIASGPVSHAEGMSTTASNAAAHAEGAMTTASGLYAHAEGSSTTASSSGSHSEGFDTIARNTGAHAEGFGSVASGYGSHAEGFDSVASGRASHVEGYVTIASGQATHVIGQYNVDLNAGTAANDKGTYVEMIGNGTADNARSNAYALDWTGTAHYAGDVYVGCNANSSGGTKVATVNDLSNKEDKTVIITITSTQNQNETVYTADKTFAQIAAAIETGKTVIATTESYGWHTYYKLTDYGVEADFPEYSFIRFSHEDGQDSARILIHYDNTIEYEVTVLSIFYGITINGTDAITNNGFANIPAAGTDTFGVVKIGNGLGINSSNGKLQVNSSSSGNVKIGTDGYAPIVPGHQHESVFYGLSKAAGVDLANETVTLGTYPSTSKIAIRKMIDALGINNIHDGLNAYMDAETGDWVLTANVQDIQINGTSILNNGIANIPIANENIAGVIKVESQSTSGLTVDNTTKGIRIAAASSNSIKASSSSRMPITPYYQHEATFYGLSKAAGVDMSSSSNAVGTYTDGAKIAIRNMIGATSSNVIAVQDEQPTDTDTKIWLPETEDTGIQVPTMEDMANYVLKTDIASSTNYGIVKATNYYGVDMIPTGSDAGFMRIYKAPSDQIKAGVNNYRPIVPSTQHEGVFYGLAKAAGDTTQTSSDNAVGTYTDDAKTAIQTMLDVPGDIQINGTSIVSNGVADIPVASTSSLGVAKIQPNYGINIAPSSYTYPSTLTINKASSNDIKSSSNAFKPIVPNNQHEATFYGLAKAAGDTTMTSSSNAVGTYTSEAKAAIHTMLGIDPASIAAQVDIPLVETVSGTTPTITGQPNVRYVCGEVSTISITPPASGSVDVIFESGSTATTMTVPSTVKWPAWFNAEALEADTTYEILITDGIYGSVMTWAT